MEIRMEYPWKYSDRPPYSWMVNDLFRGIQAQQNYLVGLGLFAYSEALGRKILGTIGVIGNGSGPRAYREFTEKYVCYSFQETEWVDIFDKFRNGLAHEYFVKGAKGAVYSDRGDATCGINISNGNFHVAMNTYFNHFVKGLESAIGAGVLK